MLSQLPAVPFEKSFARVYDYYATAMHKGARSTLHKKRMNWQNAVARRRGSNLAVEELWAEICSAIMTAEACVLMGQAHLRNHRAYLQHWVRMLSTDPMAIFTAAKDAELMAEYMLGLERQMAAMDTHKEWSQGYDQALQQ